jgi:hypothetical protein
MDEMTRAYGKIDTLTAGARLGNIFYRQQTDWVHEGVRQRCKAIHYHLRLPSFEKLMLAWTARKHWISPAGFDQHGII